MTICKQPISTNFSIVLPSQRWEWIRTVLNSIYENAVYPELIDTHIAINNGDMRIKAILDKYREKNSQVYYYETDPATFTFNNQKYPGIVAYVNYLTLQYSKGKFVMPMNDDAIFTSNNWDKNCLDKLPEGIILGIIGDDIGAKGFDGRKIPACSFPLISREGIEHFGHLFDPFFYHNTADTHIVSKYYDMKKTVDLTKELYIKHRSKELTEFIPTDYMTEVAKC